MSIKNRDLDIVMGESAETLRLVDMLIERTGSVEAAKQFVSVEAARLGFSKTDAAANTALLKKLEKDMAMSMDMEVHPPDPATGMPYLSDLYNPNDKTRVAHMLLNAGKQAAPPPKYDDRPIIDILHEGTFTNPVGLESIQDLYALRMLLRKAHCFTLDETTSSLVTDFSVAIAQDLEAARRMAIPPFPVTWVEINNTARLKRMVELGTKLTPQAAGETEAGPPVDRVGWLIQPGRDVLGSYYLSYVTVTNQGVITAPLSYWWSTGEPNPDTTTVANSFIHQIALGMSQTNVHSADAYITPSPQQDLAVLTHRFSSSTVLTMMKEISGELRHVWGFLIALAAGQNGVKLTPQSNPTRAPPIMKNGKPLLPLEHKVLHLHLRKKTPSALITQAITNHHKRNHDVRAHFRTLKSGRRVPVKSHSRGDLKLGRIEKTYQVER